MEINTPYYNPVLFTQAMVTKYHCIQSKYWNAQVLHCPDSLGEGDMQVFIRENMHFIRCKWTTFKPALFSSTDEVKLSQHVDFRITSSGNVESSYLRGYKKYEWDATIVNGLRLFIPKDCIPNRTDLIEKLNKYCIDKNVSRLL